MLLVAGVLVAAAFVFSKKKDAPTAAALSPEIIKAAPGAVEAPLSSVMTAPAQTQTLPVVSVPLLDPLSPLGLSLGPFTPVVNIAASAAQSVASILPRKEDPSELAAIVSVISGTDSNSQPVVEKVRQAIERVQYKTEAMAASAFTADVRVARELGVPARKVNYLVLGGWLTPGFVSSGLDRRLLEAAPEAKSLVRKEGDIFVRRVDLGASVPVIWAFGWTSKDTLNAGLEAVRRFYGEVGSAEPVSKPKVNPDEVIRALQQSQAVQAQRAAQEAAERTALTARLDILEAQKRAAEQAVQFAPALFGPDNTNPPISKRFLGTFAREAGSAGLLAELMAREGLFNQYGAVPYKQHGWTKQLRDIYFMNSNGSLGFVGREEP